MPRLHKDLREFIELLNSRSVEFVIVGGHAVAYHGYPRYTGDIDFFVRPTGANAAKLREVLEAFGFGGAAISMDDLTRPNSILQLGVPPNRIDILTSISGVTFDEAWATRVVDKLDGLDVNFIGRAALLKNKDASGRAKDRADLEQLEPDE
jgi:hypothetical protein